MNKKITSDTLLLIIAAAMAVLFAARLFSGAGSS